MTTETYTVFALANMAECAGPDSTESPGARFLESVADSTREQIEYAGSWDDDMASEIADSCVPVYTHDLWATFVDLAAYQEDPSELGYDASDMTKAAQVCLYMIAERLARRLGDEATDED